MKKGFVILMAVVIMATIVACGNDNPIEDDSALTRGAGVNNSTDNTKGGITIEIDTVWNGETHIGF